jgi:hypothetical protein
MLAIVSVLITLAATAMLKARMPGALQAAPFGWISEQWLEHRASHPS